MPANCPFERRVPLQGKRIWKRTRKDIAKAFCAGHIWGVGPGCSGGNRSVFLKCGACESESGERWRRSAIRRIEDYAEARTKNELAARLVVLCLSRLPG